MSWAEIMELREELKDIRKQVGGHAIRLGKDHVPRTVDDDIGDVKKEIQELRNLIANLSQELVNVRSNARAAETSVSNIAQDLKTSTDELENVLLVEDEKVKGKKK